MDELGVRCQPYSFHRLIGSVLQGSWHWLSPVITLLYHVLPFINEGSVGTAIPKLFSTVRLPFASSAPFTLRFLDGTPDITERLQGTVGQSLGNPSCLYTKDFVFVVTEAYFLATKGVPLSIVLLVQTGKKIHSCSKLPTRIPTIASEFIAQVFQACMNLGVEVSVVIKLNNSHGLYNL